MYLHYACVESKDFGQHAHMHHMRRLINAFAIKIKLSCLSSPDGMFLFYELCHLVSEGYS